MIKIKNIKLIDNTDWDELVSTTYKRPYCLQQQDGCQPRGIINITIPDETDEEEMNDEIPEIINGDIMGVKFEKWLERDPKQSVGNETEAFMITNFWNRNFYPNLQTVANDLHNKGLIEAGNYSIEINW